MHGGAPDEPAEHVAAPFVGRAARRRRSGTRRRGGGRRARRGTASSARIRDAGRRARPETVDDRREVVRAVSGAVALDDRHDPIEPSPVSTVGLGSSGRDPSGCWSNSMNTRFQNSSQRSPPHSSCGRAVGAAAGARAAPVEVDLAVVPAGAGRALRPTSSRSGARCARGARRSSRPRAAPNSASSG